MLRDIAFLIIRWNDLSDGEKAFIAKEIKQHADNNIVSKEIDRALKDDKHGRAILQKLYLRLQSQSSSTGRATAL